MTVSVVIPLFNKARHIGRAVRSVLAQTYTDFELVVIDDASTDDSGEIVQRMIEPRLRLVSQENRGECGARNRGIEESRHDLIAFLDADDEWFPGFLEIVLGLRARHPEAGMYSAAYCFGHVDSLERPAFVGCPEGREGGLIPDYFESSLGPQPVTSSSVLIPRKVLDEVGRFPKGVRAGGDLHTWTRIALRYRVAWSPREGAVYHLSADNRVSASLPEVSDVTVAEPIESFLRMGNESVSSRESIIEYLRVRRLRLALSFCIQGRQRSARALLRKAGRSKGGGRRGWFVWLAAWTPLPFIRLGLRSKAVFRQIASHFDVRDESELS
ncbi:MAG TPA: glycosyltransferase family A protein [Thermoanaerobaculia bacterium]|nr:glycosyltransferase family A protein [Thermoanaerobaculia bacterium]HQP88409.1 glycosyltransferase family A protein [Thermoanaerobaculia bacterium]